MIGQYKSRVTRQINNKLGPDGIAYPLWQRNYYDHIIRNDEEMERIYAYVLDNPRRWAEDRENPETLR